MTLEASSAEINKKHKYESLARPYIVHVEINERKHEYAHVSHLLGHKNMWGLNQVQTI